jgi:hypothetical protein
MCQGEENIITCEEAPIVVAKIHISHNSQGKIFEIIIENQVGAKRPLDPESLKLEGQALSCLWGDSGFRTHFARQAYHHLAPYFDCDADFKNYSLTIGTKKYQL